jgi:hypothetical protein
MTASGRTRIRLTPPKALTPIISHQLVGHLRLRRTDSWSFLDFAEPSPSNDRWMFLRCGRFQNHWEPSGLSVAPTLTCCQSGWIPQYFRTATPVVNPDIWHHSVALGEYKRRFLNGQQ